MAYSDYKTVVMPAPPPGGWAGKLLRTDGKVLFHIENDVSFIEPNDFVLVLEVLRGEKMKVMVLNDEQKTGTVWSTELLINTKQV